MSKANSTAREPLLNEEDGAIKDVVVNSKGAEAPPAPATTKDTGKALIISFFLMVFIGLGNKIFQVLEFIPMNNYPLFINLLTTFVYIPARCVPGGVREGERLRLLPHLTLV